MRTPDRPRPTRATFASLRCSFCGKPHSQVRSLVCGPTPDVAICDECVDLSGEIIREQLTDPTRDDHSTAA